MTQIQQDLKDYLLEQGEIAILKNGKARAIRLSTLNAICRALRCQPGDILIYEEGEDCDE